MHDRPTYTYITVNNIFVLFTRHLLPLVALPDGPSDQGRTFPTAAPWLSTSDRNDNNTTTPSGAEVNDDGYR